MLYEYTLKEDIFMITQNYSNLTFKGRVEICYGNKTKQRNMAREIYKLPTQARVRFLNNLDNLKTDLENSTPDNTNLSIEFTTETHRGSNSLYYAIHVNDSKTKENIASSFDAVRPKENLHNTLNIVDRLVANCKKNTLKEIERQETAIAEKDGINYILNRIA